MKLLRLDSHTFPVSDDERKQLKELGFNDIVEIEGYTPEEIIDNGKDADVVVVISNYLRSSVINQFGKCKAIMRRGTGCDKIDIGCATEKGIIVANLPAFADTVVADHAMMLVLAVARKLPVMQKAMESRDWIRIRNAHELTSLGGKTAGIVGFGNIGKAIAIRAKAFDMEVIDYHRNVFPEVEESFGVTPVTLMELLEHSDFVILACPLTAESRHMIAEKELKAMKPSAFLINIARGELCDEYALAQALKENRIAGAGIDVYEHLNLFADPDGQPECLFSDLENVILTPHWAAGSKETTLESITKMIAQLRMIVNGIFPSSCVNPQVYEKVRDTYKLSVI